MASSICSSRLVISPRWHTNITGYNRFIRWNFNRVSFRRKSKLLPISLKIGCKKDSNSDESDDEDDDSGGKKRHKMATWKKWAVGITLSIILPSYRRKLGPLGILKNRVDEVIETTETITEVVEDIAEDVKYLAEELEKRLPDKQRNGKLKEALDLVEKLAEETIKATDMAQELIDKVEEAEEILEDALAIAEAKKRKEKDSSRHRENH